VVRGERNRLEESAQPDVEGAQAALETFYHAFNARSLELMRQIWADDPLVQVSTPLAGIVRGARELAAGYARMFAGETRVQTEVWDIVRYATPDLVVFAGRERGTYAGHGAVQPLDVRTTCIFRYIEGQGWRQVHHHVSIDDPERLSEYQRTVRGT
jgi:ketosteroid isomerase-like protein